MPVFWMFLGLVSRKKIYIYKHIYIMTIMDTWNRKDPISYLTGEPIFSSLCLMFTNQFWEKKGAREFEWGDHGKWKMGKVIIKNCHCGLIDMAATWKIFSNQHFHELASGCLRDCTVDCVFSLPVCILTCFGFRFQSLAVVSSCAQLLPLQLDAGPTLCAYTDGVIDMPNRSETQQELPQASH